MVICTREWTHRPFNLPSPSTPSHLLFLLLWETDSQNRWHRQPRQTPYLSDENVRWYCLVLPPVLSVMTIFSLQASLHVWTAVQLSLLQKNAQVGLGFEFTGWITRARGQCGHLHCHQRPMRQGPLRAPHLGQYQPSPAPLWIVQDPWSSNTSQGRPSEEGEADLTDLASTTRRMRHALGARGEEEPRIQMKFSWENIKWLFFSFYTPRLSDIYICCKNMALLFPQRGHKLRNDLHMWAFGGGQTYGNIAYIQIKNR